MLYRAGNTTLYKEGNGRGLLALSWLWGASTAAARAMCTAGWQRRYVHAWNCYIILVPISAFWGSKKGAVEEWNVKRHCDCFRNLSQFGIFILSHFVIIIFFLIFWLEWINQVYLRANHARLKAAHTYVTDELKTLGVPFLNRNAGFFVWIDFRKVGSVRKGGFSWVEGSHLVQLCPGESSILR